MNKGSSIQIANSYLLCRLFVPWCLKRKERDEDAGFYKVDMNIKFDSTRRKI